DAARERILIEDADERISYANVAARDDLLVASPAGIVGSDFKTVIRGYEGIDSGLPARIRHAVSTEGHWAGSETFTRRSGNGDLGILRFAVWRTDTGGTIYMWSDVTDEEKQEQRERDLRDKLAQAKKTEALGSLAGGIAHDFNNIISAIQSFAQLLSIKLEGDHNQSYAERIVTSCERATSLVKQVMAFSAAGSAERTAIRVSDHLEDVFELVRATLPGNIDFTTDIPLKSPVIEANPAQIVQLILNLCINAIDAIGDSQPGHIGVSARTETFDARAASKFGSGFRQVKSIAGKKSANGAHQFVVGNVEAGRAYLILSVTDDGPGMPTEIVDRVFEPFFTTKPKGRGTGLGLAVSASAVAAMGGTIALTTSPGSGSTFQVLLPISDADLSVNAPTHENTQADDATARGRVMIVDDEIDLADAMSESLALQGFETLPVYDPEEALSLFRANPEIWQVVLTDQVMPKVNGLALIAEMKQARSDIPIILYSGFGEITTEQKALEAGAAAFFRKPVSATVISAKIDELSATVLPRGGAPGRSLVN
ncbi:MAG: response regulator, partial [Rhodobacteraceae bacterium]|nr:response regulator [Paracoccaceae bacterium]